MTKKTTADTATHAEEQPMAPADQSAADARPEAHAKPVRDARDKHIAELEAALTDALGRERELKELLHLSRNETQAAKDALVAALKPKPVVPHKVW